MKKTVLSLIMGSTLVLPAHAQSDSTRIAERSPAAGYQQIAQAQTDRDARQRLAAESAPELPTAIDKLAAQILASLPKKGESKIAIAPFTNLGPTAHQKKLGEVVSELLVTRLSGKPNVVVIERGQLNQVLEELKLSMLGLTEGSNAEKVGKLLGAEAVIVGSISEVGDKFAISARHVEVESGRVAFAKEVQVPQADTIALSSKYVVTKSRGDALFRSVLVPGWGQLYNEQDVKGYVFTGVTLGLIGAGVFQRVQYGKTHDEYMDAKSKEKATELYDKMSSQYEQSNLLFAIAGGVWVVNIVDAYLSGTSASEVRVSETATVKPVIAATTDGTQVAGLELKF